ncbi:tripartite motif-containing protein 16-like [Clupea harengus]|uniref:Tripartite motif-containing protein 16-like n=1 Tax=Clupea harengus TaxID=7950 RepID=A0A6P8FCZ9_CLUHA|nr:tripartite motif-containing protein 16-like [Clupea harengus]
MSQGDQCRGNKESANAGSGKRTNSADQLDCNGGDITVVTSGKTLKHGAQDLHTDNVLCDSCIDSPCRAEKSCLTCLVSYCEAQLRPHLQNQRFKSHHLVEPQLDSEMRCSLEHKLPLELYCRTDGCCLCHACRDQGHQEHHTEPVGEARRLAESSVIDLQITLEKQFTKLHAAVERAREEVWEVLEGELKRAVCQAEGIEAHLQEKICHLKKALVLGGRFSNNTNDVDFMQEYCEWLRGSVDTDLPGVYISLPDRLITFRQTLSDTTQELCEQLLASYRRQLTDPCQRDATSLTFNVDSAHQFLRLTVGNRRMTNTTPWQHCYPEHPERFEHWRQAFACESPFLGRHYFEVDLSGEGAYMGLTCKSIKRKSVEYSSCITGNTFSWSLGRSSHRLSCWHAGEERCLQGEPLNRVGVYVDYQAGVVAFYVVDEVH